MNHVLLPYRDVPVCLTEHLFSYRKCGRRRGVLGKQDTITKSEALKEKSREAKRKA